MAIQSRTYQPVFRSAFDNIYSNLRDGLHIALPNPTALIGSVKGPSGFDVSWAYYEPSEHLVITLDGPLLAMHFAWHRFEDYIHPFLTEF